jgi:hypothetical protein
VFGNDRRDVRGKLIANRSSVLLRPPEEIAVLEKETADFAFTDFASASGLCTPWELGTG